jgi:osmotically-inducible protein OsmY
VSPFFSIQFKDLEETLMKKELFIAAAFSMILSACDRPDNQPKSEYLAEVEVEEDVENTGRNVRDRNSNTVTPANQSENEQDRTITQNIRRAIIADDDLSMNAKNIKIITIEGVVTLRGVVENNQEKDWIEKKAKSINGVKSVDNQLEAKTGQGAYYYN